MENGQYENQRHALSVCRPASTILEAARDGGNRYSHPVLSQGDQRDRRLPHVRGGSQGRQKPGCRLRLPGKRGDGSPDQYPEGAANPARQTWSCFSPMHDKQVPVLRAQRKLRAAEALPAILGVEDEDHFAGEMHGHYDRRFRAVHMIRDNNKCILCRRCVAACREARRVGVIGAERTAGSIPISAAPLSMPLGETGLRLLRPVYCRLPDRRPSRKRINTDEVLAAIADPDKACHRADRPRLSAPLSAKSSACRWAPT